MPAPDSDPHLLLLRALLEIPAPSGREERMAALVMGQIEALGGAPQLDPQGNVWVEIEGRQSELGRLALASHLDEIGAVITAIEPDGQLRVQRSGGLYPWKLGEGPMVIVGEGASLVDAHLGFGSGHTNDPQDPIAQFIAGSRGLTWADCRLFTGLSPAELKAAGVRVGSCAVPALSARGPHLFGPAADPLVSAWILDNRGGTVALLGLLRRLQEQKLKPRRTLDLCFMVQEETGTLGARGWAARNRVEIFIAVDSSPMPTGSQLTLDGRPATWSKDAGAHFDQGLIAEMARAAARAGTELQYAVYGAAFSDATGVLETGLAPRAATVGYPRLYSHGYEVSRLSVFENLVGMLFEYVKEA